MKNIRSRTIFLALALAGICLLFIFSYLTYRSLIMGSYAKENVTQFYNNNRYLTNANNLVFIILLFVSNILFIRHRYWDTFIWTGLIFFTFALIDWWWLSEIVFHYKKKNDLLEGESNLMPFFGIAIALFVMGLTIGNYLLLKLLVKEKRHDLKDVEHDLKDSTDKQDL